MDVDKKLSLRGVETRGIPPLLEAWDSSSVVCLGFHKMRVSRSEREKKRGRV